MTMEILKVQDLCKTYGKGEAKVEALKKVSFSLDKGEFAAVVGESGSGKSTLLNCIGALDRQQRQRILGRAGEHQRHPCGGGTFPSGNGRRAERGGRCPLRELCRGRCVRPQRHDHPQ